MPVAPHAAPPPPPLPPRLEERLREEEHHARRALRERLARGPLLRAVGRQDVRVYRAIRKTARPTGLHRAILLYSEAGEHAGLWLAVGGAGALLDTADHRPRWRRALASVAAAYGLNVVLKSIFRRRRPSQEDLPHLTGTPTGLSFPSAHASSSFAAARAYSRLLPPGPLYAAASAMALSRVYLGVHYPTDIAVGASIGFSVGCVGR